MTATDNLIPLREMQIQSPVGIRLVVTIFALILIRTLFHIPIPGTSDFVLRMANDGGQFGPVVSGLPASLSVAAIALSPWLTVAILGQIYVMFAPAGLSRLVAANGFIKPFSWIVIFGAMAISYLQASGVAFSISGIILPPNSDDFQQVAIVSLMAGTAVTIVCAFVIERFGIGRGFWVTFAALSIINLSAEFSQLIEAVSSGIVAPAALVLAAAVLAGLVALIIFAVLHAQRQCASFQFVVWPLLISSLLSVPLISPKEMPEILVPILIVTLIIAALSTFVLSWRGNQPQVLLPVFGTLALVEIAAYFPLASFPFMLPLPLPTTELVTAVSLLAVLAQEFWLEFQNSRSGHDLG
jgi:preprotein translocase subunit SecY